MFIRDSVNRPSQPLGFRHWDKIGVLGLTTIVFFIELRAFFRRNIVPDHSAAFAGIGRLQELKSMSNAEQFRQLFRHGDIRTVSGA